MMKKISFFAIMLALISTYIAYGYDLPILEFDFNGFSNEQVEQQLTTALQYGYRRFFFVNIGEHASLIKDIIQQKNDVLISSINETDLECALSFEKKIGIVWKHDFLTKNQLNHIKNSKIISYGLSLQKIDPFQFSQSGYGYVKIVFSQHPLDYKHLVAQITLLKLLHNIKRFTPFISLPAYDDAYNNVDSSVIQAAKEYDKKPYQIMFAWLKRAGFIVIPIIQCQMTNEIHQEIMETFSLILLQKTFTSIKTSLSGRAGSVFQSKL